MAKEHPKIDPARQNFKTTSYDELIKKGNTPGTDSYVSKKKKMILYFLIGFVFVGTVVWCIASFNKYKKQEEALNLGNGYYDINGDWRSFDGKAPSLPDVNLEKPEEIVVPKVEPSKEILNSDILSGNFQLGPYMYTLPMSMRDLIDTGLVLYDTPTKKQNAAIEDTVISANSCGKATLQYDEYTFIDVQTYDTEAVNILDATVVGVEQLTDSEYWNENAQYVYLPGGLHVGVDAEAAAEIYNVGDGLLKVNEVPTIGGITGKQYNYNGKFDFPWNEHNFIQYTVPADSVDYVELYKNR